MFTLLCSQISAEFIIAAYLIFYCILHLYSPTHTFFVSDISMHSFIHSVLIESLL